MNTVESVETKRCRKIRRILTALFIICGYMLSTTFVGAVFNIDGKDQYVRITALNLAFGAMGGKTPVYQNPVFGAIYIILPLIGFLFMFFDKRTNLKNFVGMGCGIIGCLMIAFPIAANSELYLGIGALISMIAYMIITTLSGISIFMKIEDRRQGNETPKLS